MRDLVQETLDGLHRELARLRPAVREYDLLLETIAALDRQIDERPLAPASGGNGVGPEPGRNGAPPASARVRKRASRLRDASADRSDAGEPASLAAVRPPARRPPEDLTPRALALIAAEPGITIPRLAAMIGTMHNHLYQVLPVLAAEGKLEKHGREWYPAGGYARATVDRRRRQDMTR